MAKAPTLPTITGQFASSTQLNAAFRAIEDSFENTLSLDGSTPNSMDADLDMNGHDILNVGNLEVETLDVEELTVNGSSVQELVDRAEDAQEAAENAAAIALAGSPYRLSEFSELASRLRYSGATGSQINVAEDDVVDIPGLGAYRVAASGATDEHLDYTGAGGVKLYVKPPYNVKTFGALGDAVTDDTAAFQTAIAAGDIVIPDGNYILSGGLSPSTARYIRGLGGSFNTPTLSFGVGSYTQCINLPELSTVDGISVVDSTNSKIGLQINGTYNSVRNCRIEGCDIGIYYFANSQGNSEIKDNYIRNSVTANIKCFRAHNVAVTGNRLEYGQYGLWFDTACYDNIVVGNEISHNSVRGIFTDSTSLATKIAGNTFGAHSGIGLHMSKYHDSVIGNHFTDITGNAIYADVNHRAAVISGNTFKNCSPGLAVLQLQSENDNYQITDNIFGRPDVTPVADYCIRVRYGDKVRITGNHFTFGYLTAPILDEFPQGPVDYADFVQETKITNTDVAAGTNSVLTAKPLTGSGFYTPIIEVGYGRAHLVTIRNTTGGPLVLPDCDYYTESRVAKTSIPSQTIAGGASIIVIGRADNIGGRVVINSNGLSVPAGFTYEVGVSDRFRVRENLTSLTGVTATIGATPATLSSFDSADRSFAISPSPATGSSILISFQRDKNFP